MTMPPAVTTRLVTGRYVRADGSPAAGAEVIFTYPGVRRVSADGTTLISGDITITCDAAGEFSTPLPVTDDPDISDPLGFVLLSEPGAATRRQVHIPSGSGPINTTDLPLALTVTTDEIQYALTGIDPGVVTAGAPGSNPSISLTGGAPRPKLNITIPRGDKGDTGIKGDKGDPGGVDLANSTGTLAVTKGGTGATTAAAARTNLGAAATSHVHTFSGGDLTGDSTTARVMEPPWIAATYTAGWSSYGQTWPPARFKKLPGGLVVLQGMVQRTSGSNVSILTLPDGYRPAFETYFLGGHGGGYVPINVKPNGAVDFASGSPSNWVSLNGICFPAEA